MVARFPEERVPKETQLSCFDHYFASAKEGLAPGDLWCPRGVAVDTATNHIYVAEGETSLNFARVSIFSDQGEYLNSYTHEGMRSLWGITIYGSNLYLTDDGSHALFHFNIEHRFRFVGSRGGKGSKMGQFHFPCQLSVHTNGDIWIADSYNHRIQILNSSLRPTAALYHPTMDFPRDVKLSLGEIYVLSFNEDCFIHVFSHTGHKLRSLITVGEVERPYFFCFDSNTRLYISDWGASIIKVFSNEGALLNTLKDQDHPVGMSGGVYGLAITPNLKLVAVSWNQKNRLHIISYV